MLSYQDFCRLLADTEEFNTLDAYIADCGGSANADHAETELLATIWELGRDGLTIDSILRFSGLTAAQLGRKYGVSYKAVHHWISGIRTPSAWVLSLLAYAVLCDVCADRHG